jgi:menaquinone-dependent protoporphyrinogen oxidase
MQVAVAGAMTTPSAPTRILVTFGSKRGGTAEIADVIAGALRARGFVVDCVAADRVEGVDSYDAFVIGGAVYMSHWHRDARRFISRFLPVLRARPVWCFSSGPLDATANEREIPPVRNVARIIERIGARGHSTFGGRLADDARGFPASAMARTMAGDWRDWGQIRTWGNTIASTLESTGVDRTPIHAPTRWILATLCLVVGFAAVFGGLALAIRPDGGLLRMPLSYLQFTMFENYLIPGLLLLVFVGIGQLFTAWLVMRHSEHADLAALVCGSVLIMWIVAEMVLLRTTNALQIGTLVAGTWIIAESMRRLSQSAPPSPVPVPVPRRRAVS